MLAKLLRNLYSRMPIVGDFLRLSDSVNEMLELNRALADHVGTLTNSSGAIHLALATLRGDIANWKREIIDVLWMDHNRDVIQLFDFALEQNPRFADPARLLRYASQVNSQNGEDGMIHEIFRRIGTTDRVFAEIGCGNGIENNTAFLLSQGWTGFWLDGQDTVLKIIERRADLQGDCLKCATSFISRENVTDLMRNLGVPAEFDFLSIDVDQNTYYVWEALSRYKPRVVVIEYNAAIPNDVDWKVLYNPARTWDGTNNFGASLKALENLGRRLGYSLVGCDLIGANAFFVRAELAANLFAEPFTSENHYEPPRNAMLSRRGHRSAILDRMSTAPPNE